MRYTRKIGLELFSRLEHMLEFREVLLGSGSVWTQTFWLPESECQNINQKLQNKSVALKTRDYEKCPLNICLWPGSGYISSGSVSKLIES